MRDRYNFLILAVSAALLFLAPIRKGDLAGYDDAVYAHIAKAIVRTGDWIHIQSNGYPVLEHPPGFVWMQAALFSVFGFTDFLAKLPSALCGLGTALLVYALARRLVGAFAAVLAMFIIIATPYFIKYTAHGMTDVPFTFLFTAAVYAWVKARDRPSWYVVVTVATAYALLTRSTIGLAVPATLAILLVLERRPWRYAVPSLLITALPIATWYGYLIWLHGDFFWEVHTNFLARRVLGEADDSWRRYTGAFEYSWMLTKSYWPWLPFMGIGLVTSIRERDWRMLPLVVWVVVMFAACSLGGGRVLRYLLPAYPAFSILAALGLMKVVPEWRLQRAARWAVPIALAVAAGIAMFPPVNLHAAEIRPVALAAKAVTAEGERIGFYDAGQPRFDETGQIQWYGDRTMWILLDPEALESGLVEPLARVWIVDAETYHQHFAVRGDAEIIAESGRLVCVRLAGNSSPAQPQP